MPDVHLPTLAHRFNVTHRPDGTDHMVTVAQLRRALDAMPDEAYVVLAKDPEGNGYSPLATRRDGTPAVEPVWYLPESTWAGEIANIGPDGDGEVHEPQQGDLLAVVLDPVN